MTPVEKLSAFITRRRGRMGGWALKGVFPRQVYKSIEYGFGDKPKFKNKRQAVLRRAEDDKESAIHKAQRSDAMEEEDACTNEEGLSECIVYHCECRRVAIVGCW